MPVDIQELSEMSLVKTGELFMASGRGGTCYKVDGYRTMSIDSFKEEIVPTLSSAETNSDLKMFVIRDIYGKRVHVLWPDCVEEFQISEFKDLTAKQLTTTLKDNLHRDGIEAEGEDMPLNLPVPILKYSTSSTTYRIVAKFPSQKLIYNNTNLDLHTKIYMPPIAFGVTFDNKEHTVSYCHMAVIKEDSLDASLIKFGHLCFPNIYSHGQICMGSARTKDSTFKEKTLAQRFMETYNVIMTSHWNTDLLGSSPFPANLEMVYRRYYPSESETFNGTYGNHRMLIRVLEKEHAWQELDWSVMSGGI